MRDYLLGLVFLLTCLSILLYETEDRRDKRGMLIAFWLAFGVWTLAAVAWNVWREIRLYGLY